MSTISSSTSTATSTTTTSTATTSKTTASYTTLSTTASTSEVSTTVKEKVVTTPENPALDITSLLGDSASAKENMSDDEEDKSEVISKVDKKYTNSRRFRPRFNPPKGCL